MNRYFIYLAYNGANYCGWQTQPNARTVQQTIEEALAVWFRQSVSIVGAGRTDTGVHALRMVAHFDREERLDNLLFLTNKLNRLLPKDIAIEKIVGVCPGAHARFDALARTYHYHVTTRKDPFRQTFAYQSGGTLDFEAMNEACRILYRHIDFTSFSKLHTDTKTNHCRITHAGWEKQAGEWEWRFAITADRFLRNMVRAIVGTLFKVGRGKLTADDFEAIILAKDRGQAGDSAPAHALFLTDITYPEAIFKAEET
jgi:tRNA pseudouridine38-40 synthase